MDTIHSSDAPAAIGPYSQAVRVGNMFFLSGQTALDPTTGELVDGTVQVQTERVLMNLKAVLDAAELGFENVVRTTVYLVDMADFADMNVVYSKFFKEPFPARTTVAVLALPRGTRVEIDAIAVRS